MGWKYKRRKLLAVLLIGISAALLCIGIVLGSNKIIESARDDANARLIDEVRISRDTFELLSTDLVRYIDSYLLGLRFAYLRDNSTKNLRTILTNVPLNKSLIESVALIDQTGKMIFYSEGSLPSNIDFSQRGYFQNARTGDDRLYFSPVEIGRLSGKKRFRVTRQIFKNGVFAGVVLASVDPSVVSRIYHQLRVGPQTSISLIETKDWQIRARIPLPPDDRWEDIAAPQLLAALQTKGEGVVTDIDPADGITRTFVFKKFNDLPLAAVVGFSEQDVNSRLKDFKHRQHLFTSALIFAVFCLAALITVIAINHQNIATANRNLHTLHQKLQEMALFDSLTGLPNRNLFADRLSQALRDSERSGRRCAVIYVDLDNFKPINDSIGHDAGDHVLRVTAQRMVSAMRANDTVSRRGGDEFVILLPHADALPETLAIANRLLRFIGEPLDYHGCSCTISASIGVASYPEAGRTAEELLRAADAAMYVAKKKGKNAIAIASDEPNDIAPLS